MKFLRSFSALAFVLAALAVPPTIACSSGCTSAQQQQATQIAGVAGPIAVTVAADLCQEAATQPEPGWISLLCFVDSLLATDDAGNKPPPAQIAVRMPRAQWVAIKARASSSPGK